MSRTLTINFKSESFQFPDNRDSAGWGTEVTDWAQATTDTLNGIVSAGDVLTAYAPINNNQSSAASVLGLAFDPLTVRGAILEFTIYRSTTGVGAQEKVEAGTAYITYKSIAGTFDLTVVGSSGSGVTLSIDSLGQMKYVSDNMTPSTGYSGKITFRARAFGV